MSDNIKKMPSFTKEKAELLRRNMNKFDTETAVDPLKLEDSNDPTSIKDREFLLHVLIETLCYIMEKDEDKRKKLFNSLYKSFEANKFVDSVIDVDNLARMRRHVALRFFEHIKEVHKNLGPVSCEATIYEEPESSIPISRIEKYNEAFDELEVIARGGFGTVCKARHKVDGGIYAVKKIVFDYRKDSDYVKVMREVRNLSSLSNKYVVAYNNAWVQPVDEPYDMNSEEQESESDYTDQTTNNCSVSDQTMSYSDAFVAHSYKARKVTSYSESSSIIFQNDSQSNLNTNQSNSFNSIVFQDDSQLNLNTNQSNSFNSIVFQDDSQPNLNTSLSKPFSNMFLEDSQISSSFSQSKSSSNLSLKKEKSPSTMPEFPMLKIKMMLCIQMEFCDYDLRHWLDARNAGCKLPFNKSVPDIFKEILCGVAYIHEKEIIHRDLKPQNIFFSEAKGVMKVGDFGLATLNHTPSDEEQGSSNHSTNLGTLPYAAPEQRSNSVYDSKVDMYSLGIILIELLVRIGTKMELFKLIDDFKKKIIPEEIKQKWPEYIPLLINLLQEDQTFRKNAKQVLDMPLFQDLKIEGSNLEQKVKDLERELAYKEQEFRERERVLTQKLQEQEQMMEQRLQQQKWAMEQKFQEQQQAIEEKLDSKERLFQQVSEEVKLLKDCLNRL